MATTYPGKVEMVPTAEPFRFDRSWRFPLTRDDLWDEISRVEQFPRWWGWLRSFSADGLIPGGHAEFVVQSALPYQLRFTVDLLDIEEGRRIEAEVGGDLQGPAQLEVEDADEGCDVRLAWQLVPHDRLLKTMSQVSRPLMAWSHDQVVRLGVREFQRQIVSRRV
jgi:uncharacterized protein YndB with AHSA1/START domain